MNNHLYLTNNGVLQRSDDEVNQEVDLQDIRQMQEGYEASYISKDNIMRIMKENNMSQEEYINYLKHNKYTNIIQGSGRSLKEAKDNWNHLYFLDYDIIQWTAGTEGMHDCIKKLQDAFPNHLIIKPSNRFGIHVVLSSDNQDYNGTEHVYYALMAYRIIKSYEPVFKEKEIHKQVMDGAFFNNFNQRMNLNVLTFLGTECYLTSVFAVYNDNPQAYPKQISGFDDYVGELTGEERTVVSFYINRMFGSMKEISTERLNVKIVTSSGNRLDLNKDFCIPGVPYTGNDLRWRIVAILHSRTGYNYSKDIITRKFVQAQEMLAALETINRSTTTKYCVRNYLIERFIEANNIDEQHKKQVAPTKRFSMNSDEYITKYVDDIENELRRTSIYLVGSPNSGKTELTKILFNRLDKCIILQHQRSIMYSKFMSDASLSQYIVITKDGKKMKDAPDKMICTWDTFELMARKMDFSHHYILLDEVHNFITQLDFRRVIFGVLESLKSSHQLWMTGTPCGEEDLMPNHVRMDFNKQSTTCYEVYPILLDTTKRKEYISYMCKKINELIDNCKNTVSSSRKLVAIYDNYDHAIWQNYFGNESAHYASIYWDTKDVKEINNTAATSKQLINATSFLAEGVDIRSYVEVDVIIPVNRFVSEIQILQFVKRFRDAKVVRLYLVQYTRCFDFRIHDDVSVVINNLLEYTDGFRTSKVRNPGWDKLLMVDHLNSTDLNLIATDQKYQTLYDVFYQYISRPFNVYLAHYLQSLYSFKVSSISLEKIHNFDIPVPSRENSKLQYYVDNNYRRLYWQIENSSDFLEIIHQIENELGCEELSFRNELRNILSIIRKAGQMHCLEDCAGYFRNKKEVIQWKKIGRFCENIEYRLKELDGKITFDSSVLSGKFNASHKEKDIRNSCNLLNFQLCAGKSVATQIDRYRDIKNREKTEQERMNDLFECGRLVSIFKPEGTDRKDRNKPVELKNKATGEIHKFQSQKDCMDYLHISKPTFKALTKGGSKFSKEWVIISSS